MNASFQPWAKGSTWNPAIGRAEAGDNSYAYDYDSLMGELRMMFGDGDEWGTVMQAWFGVAAELHFRHPDNVPTSWLYRPSPIAYDDPRETDDFLYDLFAAADTASLLRFGYVVNRYADRLRRAGKNY